MHLISDNDYNPLAKACNTYQDRLVPWLARLLILCTVDISDPASGRVIVHPNQLITLPICCSIDIGNSSITGNSPALYPTPGSRVLVFRGVGYKGGIIVAVYPGKQVYPAYINFNRIFNYEDITPAQTLVIYQKLQLKIESSSRATLTPLSADAARSDMQAGDYLVGDKQAGSYIFLGKAINKVHAGGLADILLTSIGNKITVTADRHEYISPRNYEIKSANTDITLRAITDIEGMGAPTTDDKPFTYTETEDAAYQALYLNQLSTDSLTATNKHSKLFENYTIRPLYRQQRFSGVTVNGDWYTNVTDAYDNTEHYGEKLSFTALRSTALTVTGTIRTLTVKSITTVKSSATAGIQHSVQAEQEYIETKAPDCQPMDYALWLDAQYALLTNDLKQSLQRNNITELQRDAFVQLGLYLAKDTLRLTADWKESQLVDVGATQLLKKPASTDIKNRNNDQLLEKSTKVYNNTSFISQLLDGSIVIRDGWGSLIRMTGGNIYISSALDTFIRPGRDLISLVPRTMAATANSNIELASKKLVAIVSLGDVFATAGSSKEKKGRVVIESKSNKEGSDITLRSVLNVAVLAGNNIMINTIKADSIGKSYLAGDGSVYIRGNDISVYAQRDLTNTGSTVTQVAYSGNVGSAIQMTRQNIALSTEYIDLDSSAVIVGSVAGTKQFTVLSADGGLNSVLITSGSSGNSSIYLYGSTVCNGSMTVKSQILGFGNVIADGYANISKDQLMISPIGLQAQSKLQQQKTALFVTYTKDLRLNIGDYGAAGIAPQADRDELVKFLYTLKNSALYGFGVAYTVPGMSWQQFDRAQGDLIFEPVLLASMVSLLDDSNTYPGKTIWVSGKISTLLANYKIKQEKLLYQNYKTNTNKENDDE